MSRAVYISPGLPPRYLCFQMRIYKCQKWFCSVATLIIVLGAVSCGKKVAPKAAAPSKHTPGAAAPVTDKEILNAISDSSRTAKPGADRDDDLDRAIDTYKREHPFRDANELLKQETFLEKLRPLLEAAVKDHQFTDRVQKSVDFAAELREGKAAPGSYKLDLKVDNYTPEQTDRLLGTVLSGKPEKLVNFVLTEIDQAAVEFTILSNQTRASNGVTVQPNPPPAPPP